MAFSRYDGTPRINLGTQMGTSTDISTLRLAIKAGRVPIVKVIVTSGIERLDVLSGAIYGDASYWWVLAASSDIGWGLQVPPDTAINVVSLSDVQTIVG